MGNDRGINKEQSPEKIYSRLSAELNVTKDQLYNLWILYNVTVNRVGRKNALSDLIMQSDSYNLQALKYFMAVGFETINKGYFEGVK